MSILDIIFSVNAIIQEVKSIAQDVHESAHLAKKVALKLERVGGLLSQAAEFTNEMNRKIFEQFQRLVLDIKSTLAGFTRRNLLLTDRLLAYCNKVIYRKRNIQLFQSYSIDIDIFLQELTQAFTIQGNATLMQKIYEVRTVVRLNGPNSAVYRDYDASPVSKSQPEMLH